MTMERGNVGGDDRVSCGAAGGRAAADLRDGDLRSHLVAAASGAAVVSARRREVIARMHAMRGEGASTSQIMSFAYARLRMGRGEVRQILFGAAR